MQIVSGLIGVLHWYEYSCDSHCDALCCWLPTSERPSQHRMALMLPPIVTIDHAANTIHRLVDLMNPPSRTADHPASHHLGDHLQSANRFRHHNPAGRSHSWA